MQRRFGDFLTESLCSPEPFVRDGSVSILLNLVVNRAPPSSTEVAEDLLESWVKISVHIWHMIDSESDALKQAVIESLVASAPLLFPARATSSVPSNTGLKCAFVISCGLSGFSTHTKMSAVAALRTMLPYLGDVLNNPKHAEATMKPFRKIIEDTVHWAGVIVQDMPTMPTRNGPSPVPQSCGSPSPPMSPSDPSRSPRETLARYQLLAECMLTLSELGNRYPLVMLPYLPLLVAPILTLLDIAKPAALRCCSSVLGSSRNGTPLTLSPMPQDSKEFKTPVKSDSTSTMAMAMMGSPSDWRSVLSSADRNLMRRNHQALLSDPLSPPHLFPATTAVPPAATAGGCEGVGVGIGATPPPVATQQNLSALFSSLSVEEEKEAGDLSPRSRDEPPLHPKPSKGPVQVPLGECKPDGPSFSPSPKSAFAAAGSPLAKSSTLPKPPQHRSPQHSPPRDSSEVVSAPSREPPVQGSNPSSVPNQTMGVSGGTPVPAVSPDNLDMEREGHYWQLVACAAAVDLWSNIIDHELNAAKHGGWTWSDDYMDQSPSSENPTNSERGHSHPHQHHHPRLPAKSYLFQLLPFVCALPCRAYSMDPSSVRLSDQLHRSVSRFLCLCCESLGADIVPALSKYVNSSTKSLKMKRIHAALFCLGSVISPLSECTAPGERVPTPSARPPSRPESTTPTQGDPHHISSPIPSFSHLMTATSQSTSSSSQMSSLASPVTQLPGILPLPTRAFSPPVVPPPQSCVARVMSPAPAIPSPSRYTPLFSELVSQDSGGGVSSENNAAQLSSSNIPTNNANLAKHSALDALPLQDLVLKAISVLNEESDPTVRTTACWALSQLCHHTSLPSIVDHSSAIFESAHSAIRSLLESRGNFEIFELSEQESGLLEIACDVLNNLPSSPTQRSPLALTCLSVIRHSRQASVLLPTYQLLRWLLSSPKTSESGAAGDEAKSATPPFPGIDFSRLFRDTLTSLHQSSSRRPPSASAQSPSPSPRPAGGSASPIQLHAAMCGLLSEIVPFLSKSELSLCMPDLVTALLNVLVGSAELSQGDGGVSSSHLVREVVIVVGKATAALASPLPPTQLQPPTDSGVTNASEMVNAAASAFVPFLCSCVQQGTDADLRNTAAETAAGLLEAMVTQREAHKDVIIQMCAQLATSIHSALDSLFAFTPSHHPLTAAVSSSTPSDQTLPRAPLHPLDSVTQCHCRRDALLLPSLCGAAQRVISVLLLAHGEQSVPIIKSQELVFRLVSLLSRIVHSVDPASPLEKLAPVFAQSCDVAFSSMDTLFKRFGPLHYVSMRATIQPLVAALLRGPSASSLTSSTLIPRLSALSQHMALGVLCALFSLLYLHSDPTTSTTSTPCVVAQNKPLNRSPRSSLISASSSEFIPTRRGSSPRSFAPIPQIAAAAAAAGTPRDRSPISFRQISSPHFAAESPVIIGERRSSPSPVPIPDPLFHLTPTQLVLSCRDIIKHCMKSGSVDLQFKACELFALFCTQSVAGDAITLATFVFSGLDLCLKSPSQAVCGIASVCVARSVARFREAQDLEPPSPSPSASPLHFAPLSPSPNLNPSSPTRPNAASRGSSTPLPAPIPIPPDFVPLSSSSNNENSTTASPPSPTPHQSAFKPKPGSPVFATSGGPFSPVSPRNGSNGPAAIQPQKQLLSTPTPVPPSISPRQFSALAGSPSPSTRLHRTSLPPSSPPVVMTPNSFVVGQNARPLRAAFCSRTFLDISNAFPVGSLSNISQWCQGNVEILQFFEAAIGTLSPDQLIVAAPTIVKKCEAVSLACRNVLSTTHQDAAQATALEELCKHCDSNKEKFQELSRVGQA